MKKLLYLAIISCLLLCACRRMDTAAVLRRADTLVVANPDSAIKLLALIENPGQLPYEEQMLYGWLRAYIHNLWRNSMAEDSLILPASAYYISRQDTAKLLTSYILKSNYLHWQNQHEQSMSVLDSGITEATIRKDTNRLVEMLATKSHHYVYVWKDYQKAVKTFHKAISIREDAELCYSQGIAMGLLGDDSASWYLNRSISLAMQKKDTIRMMHYIRNYAQYMAYIENNYHQAIDISRHLVELPVDKVQKVMTFFVMTECYLKMGQLDSAQYYLEKGQHLAATMRKFLTSENMISQYQTLIDYTRHRTFDILQVMRYNDSVNNALTALQSTINRKDESKESLTNANLKLTVERQETQLTLLFSLLALLVLGGGAFLYIRNRRNKLIEAEERIETLNRLLSEATKGDAEVSGNSATEVEDGQFFRKILLQQLGIIRLVAMQPTSQNQELLRRISGITNREVPVESLLVWEDLYPVINRIYDDFYSKMNQRFGSVLIDKEQQLCCLLCAEFSTKEISVVTQQSIPTIYQRKTNIRKKLGMGEKEDIVTFILGNYTDE